MTDSNELNNETRLPIRDTVRTAWNQVSGFKALAWGGTGFYLLISLAISLLAGTVFAILLSATGLPTDSSTLHQAGLSREMIISEGLQILLNVIISFFTAPLIVGQVMLAVRHLRRSPETNVYCLFNYFKWRYMWRFFAVNMILFMLIFACVFLIALIFSTSLLLPQHIAAVALLLKGLMITGVIAFFLVLTYLMITLQFSQLLIADQDAEVGPSIKTSLRVVRKNFWRIIAVFLLCCLIILPIELVLVGVFFGFAHLQLQWLGALLVAIAAIILVIWLLPWGLLVNGLVYERLFGNK